MDVRQRFIGAVLLLACGVTPGAEAAASDWPMFQHDARHSGCSEDTDIAVPMRPAWTFQANGPIRCQPVIKGNIVFFGSLDHKVYAVAADTGERIWSFIADAEIVCTASADEDSVYVAADDGCLYALDAKSGALRWKAGLCRTPPSATPTHQTLAKSQPLVPPWRPDGPAAVDGLSKPTLQMPRAPLLLGGGLVFAGTGVAGGWGHLQAFDARTGACRWTRPATVQGTYRHWSGAESAPILLGDILFWPDYVIEALDPRTGERIPRWPTAGLYRAGAYASFNNQIAAREDGLAVMFVDTAHFPHSGRPATSWSIDLFEHSVRFTMGLQGGIPQEGQCPLLDGDRVWFARLSAKSPTRPEVCCFDLATGMELASGSGRGGDALNGCLVRANGLVFGVSRDGAINAFPSLPAGKQIEPVWSHALNVEVRGSAAVAGGRYFIGAEDGKLRAFVRQEAP